MGIGEKVFMRPIDRKRKNKNTAGERIGRKGLEQGSHFQLLFHISPLVRSSRTTAAGEREKHFLKEERHLAPRTLVRAGRGVLPRGKEDRDAKPKEVTLRKPGQIRPSLNPYSYIRVLHAYKERNSLC